MIFPTECGNTLGLEGREMHTQHCHGIMDPRREGLTGRKWKGLGVLHVITTGVWDLKGHQSTPSIATPVTFHSLPGNAGGTQNTEV